MAGPNIGKFNKTVTVGTRPLGGGNVPAARGFNPYDHTTNYGNKIARMRADSNIFAGRINMRAEMAGVVPSSNANDMAGAIMGVQVGMALGKGIVGLAAAIKQAVGNNKADGPGNKPATMTNVNSNNGNAPVQTANTLAGTSAGNSITAMKGAQDSVSLRSAIETAQGELSKMESEHEAGKAEYETAKQSLEGLKKDIETTEGELKKAKDARQKYDSEVTKKESALAQAKNDYGDATKDLSAKQKEYAFAKE